MVAMKEIDEQPDYMIVPDVMGVRKNEKNPANEKQVSHISLISCCHKDSE